MSFQEKMYFFLLFYWNLISWYFRSIFKRISFSSFVSLWEFLKEDKTIKKQFANPSQWNSFLLFWNLFFQGFSFSWNILVIRLREEERRRTICRRWNTRRRWTLRYKDSPVFPSNFVLQKQKQERYYKRCKWCTY